MLVSNIPFSQFPMLAKTDRAYAEQDASLQKFYKYSTEIKQFKQIIADKITDKTDRNLLVSTLKKQYLGLNTEGVVLSQIDKLASEKTFTVTTAHQPSLFTGPLYFVYKIFSTIHLAEKLNAYYVDNQFIPIFVIGGEDHDFEEVNNINIFNKKITWENNEKGAVGMMQTASLKTALEELKNVLGTSENAQRIFEIVEKSYVENAVYQDATQALLNELFGRYGLVVLNMNDEDLKRAFIPIMKREISEQLSKPLVEQTQAELDKLGFKAQAFPREINLFYLRQNLRERIVFENGIYKALNTDFQWNTLEDILKELNETPQYFSPNVVLRPLFQELILPNLAYIGGGGELAYWLERKTQFEAFSVNFPMLIRRNSVTVLDKGSKDRLDKLGLQLIDLVGNTDIFINQYVTSRSETPLSMEAEKRAFADIFNAIIEKAMSVDPTLEKAVSAEKTKQLQSLDLIESKLLKAEKQKSETSVNQIKTLAQKFFPNGGLQERFDNMLPYYLKYGEEFFTVLWDNLNPLEGGMIVISE